MPKTAGDHIREAMSRLPGLQELEAMTLYSSALRTLYGEKKWLFLLKNDIISTEAPYETGTIAVTNASASVVGSGTTWSAGWVNRRIVVEGEPTVFDVVFSSATAATLQAGGANVLWTGDTAAGLAYRVYRDIYLLSSACDWGREYFWWDPQCSLPLPMVDTAQMLTWKAMVQGQLGQPNAVSRAPMQQSAATVAPSAAVEFGPYAPDGVYRFPLWFFRKPAVTAADNEYPLWPEEFEDLIVRRMEIDYSDNPRHRMQLAPTRRQEYYDRLWKCFKRNDGGAEITRVKAIYNGGGGGVPFANVNVLPDTSGWPNA